MNEQESNDFNRREFLKGGSVATLMTMLGGVELFGQTNAPSPTTEYHGSKIQVGVIGLGSWGRDILNTLSRVPSVELAAICDTYPASMRRSAEFAPKAVQTKDYKTILDNKDVSAVVVATPTHQHKEIVLGA